MGKGPATFSSKRSLSADIRTSRIPAPGLPQCRYRHEVPSQGTQISLDSNRSVSYIEGGSQGESFPIGEAVQPDSASAAGFRDDKRRSRGLTSPPGIRSEAPSAIFGCLLLTFGEQCCAGFCFGQLLPQPPDLASLAPRSPKRAGRASLSYLDPPLRPKLCLAGATARNSAIASSRARLRCASSSPCFPAFVDVAGGSSCRTSAFGSLRSRASKSETRTLITPSRRSKRP